jgi:hypothetical protein
LGLALAKKDIMINDFFPVFLSTMSSNPQGGQQMLQEYSLKPFKGCQTMTTS